MEKINKVEKKQKMAGKTAPFEVNSCLLFPAENQQVQIYLILKRKDVGLTGETLVLVVGWLLVD